MSNTRRPDDYRQTVDSAIRQTLHELRKAQTLLKTGKRITAAKVKQAEQELARSQDKPSDNS